MKQHVYGAGLFARKWMSGAACALALLLLPACGAHRLSPESSADADCHRLQGLQVPASAIGLPTSGAAVTSALIIPEVASPSGAALPAHCKVLGSIKPIDASAPSIHFELALPVAWNGKAMMFGGGGFNGTIPNTAGNVPAGPADQPVPLARGYAVFASDSGHQSAHAAMARLKAAMDASFALNPEALRNYAGDGLKKTRDTALHLIRARYGVSRVERAYFAGGSTGGREAFQVVQRWPQDWDGVIAWYPAWNHISLVLQVQRTANALAAPGAWFNLAKRRLLFDAVLKVCDALDGVEDGLISRVAACNAKFDPGAIRCAGGGDAGDHCLSDAQIRVLEIFDTPLAFNPPLASGETGYPGYNVYGADLGMAGEGPLKDFVAALAWGTSAPATPPVAGESPSMNVFSDQWLRFVFAGDPGYKTTAAGAAAEGHLRPRIDELSKILDANATDLSVYAGRGGKMIVAHGATDILVSARSTGDYFSRLQSSMGKQEVAEFLRYYEIPGYGHGPSVLFNASWDSLTALENWVERSMPPKNEVVVDAAHASKRSRPLCDYPQWPRYLGFGDVNIASSFECVDH